jgi:hypothetical protein
MVRRMLGPRVLFVCLLAAALTVAACDGDSADSGGAGTGSGSADSSATGSPSASEQDGAGARGNADGSPVYVGARPGIPVEAVPFGEPAARPAILETSDDALVIRLRWRRWGATAAVGRGVARINSCEPTCASGRLEHHAGVVVTLGDLRSGACRGRPARFYTRAVVEWPPGLGLPRRQAFELLPRCIEVG